FITFGMNPVGIGPNSSKMINALSKLKWMVVGENYEIETATFWKAPKQYGGPDTASIKTEVFQLPCASFAEKDGSFTNSARWLQWKWKAIDPPGEVKADQEILARVLLAVQELYRKEGGATPEPVLNVNWSYTNPHNPDLAEVAKEINGKALADIKDPKDPTKIIAKAGEQLSGFGQLQDDGTTMCGNWLHSGCYTQAGNMMQRRNNADPLGLGMFHEWGFSWPANRRVMYNRASADAQGKPWDPTRPGIAWNGEKWVGDVPDMKPDAPPGTYGAFIMNPEGVGRLFAPALSDGPFAEHYEAVEAAIANPLHPKVTSNPATMALLKRFKTDKDVWGKADQFPIVCTTYRLTEHYHYWTHHTNILNQLQPGFFIEIPEALAKEKGIVNGGRAKVTSARGSIEGVAMVTKRLYQMTIDGKPVWHIGFPIHWGYEGDQNHLGPLANFMTPTAMDPNTWTPEFKTFLVKLEKAGSGNA
ncbi:MAG TPA: molybdopterin dinucleotide binding domain-containing protein, partial [Myxococcales bacterium]|nr:molybdopterin dinucleotide binding domain-containing protein [Myxococcales bacterium]